MNELPDRGVNSRIVETIQTLPAGFSHSTLIVFGKGMNETFASWVMRCSLYLASNLPQSAEHNFSKLGYWTDNGAITSTSSNRYSVTPEHCWPSETNSKLGIPLGYMQLDSWWYPKGEDGRWDAKGNTVPLANTFIGR